MPKARPGAERWPQSAGQPPRHRARTFAGPLSHGSFQQLVIRNHPGYYVVACFMQTQDGRDHVLLGMERVIHIVK